MRYARIIGNAVESFREFAIAPDPNPAKGIVWKPSPLVLQPSFNSKTQVLEGPTYTVGETEVTESWSVRNKTGPEIAAEKKASVGAINGNYKTQITILLDLHNRLRALEQQTPHTMEEFEDYAEGLL